MTEQVKQKEEIIDDAPRNQYPKDERCIPYDNDLEIQDREGKILDD